jgi:hypothetical protein
MPKVLALLLAVVAASEDVRPPSIGVQVSQLQLSGIDFNATIVLPPYVFGAAWGKTVKVAIKDRNGAEKSFTLNTRDTHGRAALSQQVTLAGIHGTGRAKYELSFPELPKLKPTDFSTFVMPGVLSLLPPIITLLLSVLLRQVMVALLVGIWSGAMLLSAGNPIAGLLRTFDTYVVNAFLADGHAGILLFTFILGGMIAVVQKCGGAMGLALAAKPFAKNRFRGQLTTIGLGCLIFFDDYSSILIVGNSLKPLLRTIHVSPEKFALIVHTMGVCLASFFPVSSWVGVELGYIAEQYSSLGITSDPYIACLTSIQYRYRT